MFTATAFGWWLVTDIEQFNFDGLDVTALSWHEVHGACVASEQFIRWLGWARPSDVRRDHLQPGDEVEISTSIKRGRGVAQRDVKHLTKRGVRRLLFRSNNPRAVAYADQVLDVLDEMDRKGYSIRESITDDQLAGAADEVAERRKLRLEELSDYRSVLDSLKLGGAESGDYAFIQNYLYIGTLGETAAQIRARGPERQQNGVLRKDGSGYRKSKVAKDFLTVAELARLDAVVLATVAQLRFTCPKGATPKQVVAAIDAAISMVNAAEERGDAA